MSATLQDELRTLFSRARMPSSPALAARILDLAEDPDSTVDQFADLIQMDPALAGRLLRMTNSSAFGQRQKITTIQRAVSLLGINRVRTVSLGFQLVGHLDHLGGHLFDMKQFWKHSLLRACLGREFAEASVPSGADEAFLIGLLQDCGTLLLVQILGSTYADWCQSNDLSPSASFAAENSLHRYNHAQATAALAREWNLPDVIVTNVDQHHTEPPLMPSPAESDRLRSVTYLAGSVPLTTVELVGTAEPGLAEFAKLHLGMDAEAVQNALVLAGQAYAEMADMLKGVVPDDLDVTDLLGQANMHLTTTVESERRQSSQQQAQLKSALGEYRERAARDPLTEILNRGALNDAVRDSIQQGQQAGQTITVLFLDLDNFKRLNDALGHQAGDQVLKGVADTLKRCIPNAGIVGRYGGEEFLLAVTGLTEAAARQCAEHVLAGVRDTQFPGLEIPGSVTCSLGAVWGVPDPDMTAEGISNAADELMYQAKRTGKDRCCFRTLDDVYNVDLLESDGAAVDACTSAILDHAEQLKDRTILPEQYKRIAKMLDDGARQQMSNIRKSVRKKLLTPCQLTTIVGATLEFESESGYLRNISTGGVGVLTARSMSRGKPIEVAILTDSEKPTLYVAGVVAFCRHAEGAIHEIGVQLFTHSQQPILSDDPISAIRNLDWVAQALQRRQRAAPVTV